MSRPARYEYLLEVEQSGGARSYLAIDRHSGVQAGRRAQLVTVHLAPASVASDDERRARFARRAAALRPLRHQNLVRVLDHAAESRCCYWVSEAVQGQPLSALLTKTRNGRRALSTPELIAILCDVLRGLEHLHGAADLGSAPMPSRHAPIVHQDLCPSSVLVSYAGLVQVSDGISRGFADAPDSLDGLAQRFAYQAPECFRGGAVGAAVDRRADLYAIGAMLWEGVVGHPRTVGVSLRQSIEMRLQGSEPDVASACPGVSAALAAVIRRALASNPDERQQSARELRQELELLELYEASGRERGSLFGFMCNHFCEEYVALQELLEERAPDALTTAGEPAESATSVASAEWGESAAESADDLPARDSAFALPARDPISLPGLARVTADVARESSGMPWLRRRVEQAVALLAIAGAASLGLIIASPPGQPPFGGSRAQLRRSASPVAEAPVRPAAGASASAIGAPGGNAFVGADAATVSGRTGSPAGDTRLDLPMVKGRPAPMIDKEDLHSP